MKDLSFASQSNERTGAALFLGRAAAAAVIIVLAVFTARFLCAPVTVSGYSMDPVLTDGDLVLTDRIRYALVSPARGDVILFRRGDGSLSVKRIIGLPGETLQITGGEVLIDGKKLTLKGEPVKVSSAGLAAQPVTVPEGCYFVLGDHAESSEDSRVAGVGNVERKDIVGKVWFCVLRLEDLGPVGSSGYRLQ